MRIPTSFVRQPAEPTLVQRVTVALEERIRNGELATGDALPSERELGALLSVSRTVVRSAITDLMARGLLEPRVGGGYQVTAPSLARVSDSLGFVLRSGQKGLDYGHIHQARRVLEVEIAVKAAANRTSADLAAMQLWLDRMQAQNAPTEAYCDADVAFHRTLAVATQNPMFVILLDAIADILMDVRRSGTRLRGSVASGMQHHRALFEAVQNRDEDAARAAMIAHLEDAESIQRRVTTGETPEGS